MRCWRCDYETGSRTCERCGVWVIDLRADAVPSSVAGMLPLARRWGIPDDGYRVDEVDRATEAELRLLVEVVDAAPDELWDWLTQPASAEPSAEYVALSCLTMAFDQARLRVP